MGISDLRSNGHCVEPGHLLEQQPALEAGVDGLSSDPMSDQKLTPALFAEVTRRVRALAYESAEGRLLVLGGGGVLALAVSGQYMSVPASVGFIALMGIAVLNGVVMVSYIRDLQREGLSLMDATEKGARLRLRAVLMTALTDGIGFLPMAISTIISPCVLVPAI